MKYLSKAKYYILACSGGPDSMALFHMLLEEDIPFAVAFVNYHKRKESDKEEAFVKQYALDHNREFFVLDAVKTTSGGNFQAWARNERYEFFANLAGAIAADGIVVAHQEDDHLETYLMQKKRGGIYSHYGLQELSIYKDVPLIRPLLHYRKKELLNYCIANKVPYSIDVTNLKNDYERNRIRHEVVEPMDEAEVIEMLEKIELENRTNDLLKSQTDEFLDGYNGMYPIDKFEALNLEIQKRVLYQIVNDFDIECSGPELDAIRLFILSKRPNSELPLKEGVTIYKNYGVFEFSDNKEHPYTFIVNKNENVENDLFYFNFKLGAKAFYVKEDSYPLVISNAEMEDKVKIGEVTKKINRLFIDEKIPMRFRKIWPVVKDSTGKIIFIPRKREIHLQDKKKTLVFCMKTPHKKVNKD